MKKKPHSRKLVEDTINFYSENHEDYSFRTFNLNLQDLYKPFLSLLAPAGKILDAGCGPGRDVKKFTELGYNVTGFDASPMMVELAKKNNPTSNIQILKFDDLDISDEFDGIWACASLLHVPNEDMEDVFLKLSKSLKREGALYCSFKYGEGRIQKGDRFFTLMNEDEFLHLTTKVGLEVQKIWITEDVRPERRNEKWLNAVCRKS